MKKNLVIALKLLVSAGALYWLYRSGLFDDYDTRLANAHWEFVLLSCLVICLQFMCAALRWKVVGESLGISLKYPDYLRLTYFGAFFGLVLPGAVGGDLVKTWYLAKSSDRTWTAVQCILLDRLVSMIGLLGVIILSLPVYFMVLPGGIETWSMVFVAVAGVCGVFIILLVPRFLKGDDINRPLGLLNDLCSAFLNLVRQPKIGGAVLALGGLSQGVAILSILLMFLAFGVDVSFLITAAIMAPVILISLLPISIAGWGVREAALVTATAFIGIAAEDAVTVSLSFGLLVTLSSLPGGLLWLLNRRDIPDNDA